MVVFFSVQRQGKYSRGLLIIYWISLMQAKGPLPLSYMAINKARLSKKKGPSCSHAPAREYIPV